MAGLVAAEQRRLAIQAALEDVGDAPQVRCADGHGARAGGLHRSAVYRRTGPQAQAGAVALLGVRAGSSTWCTALAVLGADR